MGKTTIEWTHFSFNPIWGCLKVSEECQHCYADTLASRWGYHLWGPAANTTRRTFGEKHWQEPLAWNKEATRRGERLRVFCASMADVYEDHPIANQERPKLWPLIEQTPMLDWLILTKRPENILSMTPQFYPNMWIGTSVGTQKRVDERLPYLLKVPARVRFLSCEPLLESLDLTPWLTCCPSCGYPRAKDYTGCGYCEEYPEVRGISWVITGGESGRGHRPCHPDWVRTIRDQCVDAGVAYFHKQWGGHTSKAGGRLLDGKIWNEFPKY